MLPPIRLATPEEISKIAKISDLTASSSVWAFPDNNPEKEPILGVIRQCYEVDPIHFPEGTSDQRKVLYAWGIFNILRSMNVPEIYFNVGISQEQYIKVLEKLGAENLNTEPQFRFKKAI